MRLGGQPTGSHWVKHAAQVADEIGVKHTNPTATPRHNPLGEHKFAFNNPTCCGTNYNVVQTAFIAVASLQFQRPTH
jgi:hypothetical protein